MNNKLIKIGLFFTLLFASTKTTLAQYGTTKFCPNTPAWKINKAMVENAQSMYIDYAKGPDGCWWLKVAKFSSYPEGFYQFTFSGTRYYFNERKNFWENGIRTVCVNPPLGQ